MGYEGARAWGVCARVRTWGGHRQHVRVARARCGWGGDQGGRRAGKRECEGGAWIYRMK